MYVQAKSVNKKCIDIRYQMYDHRRNPKYVDCYIRKREVENLKHGKLLFDTLKFKLQDSVLYKNRNSFLNDPTGTELNIS